MESRTSTRPRTAGSIAVGSDDEDDVQVYQSRQSNRRGDKPAAKRDKPSDTRKDDDDDDRSLPPDTPELSSSDEIDPEEQQRHPFYTYVTEKQDSFADAKVIYQRHRLDTSSSQGATDFHPLAKASTMPIFSDGEASGFKRGPSFSATRDFAPSKISISSEAGSSHRKEAFPTMEEEEDDSALAADAKARAHQNHPNLPHEFKDPLLVSEGVHGAGAGVGLGSGPGGLARNEESIVSEVQSICEKIKSLLDLRQRFMKVSLQCPGDNPKDYEDWLIYPPPPEPVWSDDKNRPMTHNEIMWQLASAADMRDDFPSTRNSSSLYMHDGHHTGSGGGRAPSDHALTSPTTGKKRRKAGHDIGGDFDLKEVHIPRQAKDGLHFKLDEGGVYQIHDRNGKQLSDIPTLRDYYMALDSVLDVSSDGPAKSFAYRRLQYLEGRYNLYSLLNEYEEVADTKKVPHRDFYNVRKVDTHVHHSACMNQKHLLRFIKSKMKKCPDDLVIDRDGKILTLREVFETINLTAYDLSIDTLDMHAHTDSFHRFDKFNLKYNPIGQSRLRDIFLKTDNYIKGKYLAEITREVISDLESSKYQMVEWRISIYGRNIHEWDKLAAWVVDNKLFSHNVRWLIQIPRLWALYKSLGHMTSFEEVIRNVFLPLFEVTKDPSSHPKLHIFLQRVIGFDSVDDESKPERRLYRKFPVPNEWTTKQNPPYGYWIYYLFANMASLNAWRKRRGFNTFLLRPHCGEAGDTDHLAAAFLCAHSISHGIMLRKVPLLQYLFYLEQIGIAMSPLSNNALFLTYDRNPFISYFKKGLNVSLSTDDPLQFAFTKEPLIEEYSVAAQIYKLGSVDMCELAKHSVDQCGFELSLKQRWLGKYCYLPGVLGNDVAKCNVPDVREAFRHETLRAEHAFIAKYTENYIHLERCSPSMPAPDPATPIHEQFKALESPRSYYQTVADSITPAQTARMRNVNSSNSITNSVNNEVLSSSPPRLRKASTVFGAQQTGSHDSHISGHEPRAFPGIAHQRERRRSLRLSASGSDGAGEMNASAALEPGLAKLAVREEKRVDEAEDDE